jgi:hypothetical protein
MHLPSEVKLDVSPYCEGNQVEDNTGEKKALRGGHPFE